MSTEEPTARAAAHKLLIPSIIGGVAIFFMSLIHAGNFPLQDLGAYYLQTVGVTDSDLARLGSANPWMVPLQNAPNVRVIGGAADPPPNVYGIYNVPIRLAYLSPVSETNINDGYRFYGYRDDACGTSMATVPVSPSIGGKITLSNQMWEKYIGVWNDNSGCYDPLQSGPRPRQQLTVREDRSFNAPVRRSAVDGGHYDASPMVVKRNDVPWASYYWAYRMGMVATESNWDEVNANRVPELVSFFQLPSPSNNFELASLPPPWIEDDVVEYVNQKDFPKQPDGQFFYAVLAADKAALDAVASWRRTGKSFKSGGYVSVCRFYGGLNGGPNTHFYSAEDQECEALKKVPVLSYEGQTFAVNMPMPAKTASQALPGALRDCPAKSKPLYRLYNNASAPGKDYVSNHRYVTDRADVNAAVAQGWVDEGHVMCVPE